MPGFNLIIFEDSRADRFYPLSVSHPVFELLCGCFNAVERYKRFFKPDHIYLICREHLADIARLKFNLPVNDLTGIREDCLFINAALMPDKNVFNKLLMAEINTAFLNGDRLAGLKLSAKDVNSLSLKWSFDQAESVFQNVEKSAIESTHFDYLWDLVNFNNKAIEFDCEYIDRIDKWAEIAEQHESGKDIYIHPSATVAAGAFIDARNGPVIIDENVVVQPRSLIEGPAYIGKNSYVLAGIIREGCSLGPVCKVGGELEESILIGYSNKAHEGFIGHSYLGEWVNLGALTTNSDLKNNYSEIKARLRGEDTATGSIKAGCFIGDHTKTGIGTLLNTGMVVGFSCNIFGGALFIDKEIGCFKWGTPGNLEQYKLEKAIEVAQTVMKRRDMEFSEFHENLFRYINRSNNV